VSQIEAKVREIASAQVVVSREGHEDRMEVRVVLAEGIAPSDRLTTRIAEEIREVTRLGGAVRYVSAGETEEGGKKIVDRRKWD
jgi:phenylacetate-coenzyme A ligase PaaK-like adenylate-forming protein